MHSIHKLALAGVLAGAAMPAPTPALAHAIVGDRVFPVTLAVDDPGVADEISLPTFAFIKNGDGANETDLSFEFDKRITEDFAISVAGTWTRLKPGGSGFQNLELGFKYLLYANAPHEFMLSAGVEIEPGGTGAARVGAEGFTTVTPQIFFGKGFGDLPDSMAWAKPFAVTGQIGLSFADTPSSRTYTANPAGGAIDIDIDRHPAYLEWGFTLQYSLPYLNAHVREIDGPDFLRRLTPVVEFAFETPVANRVAGEGTTGTINPGVIYSGDTYQVAVEAMVPINKASGKHVGVIAQMHFFLDDIFPTTLGKPIFSGH